MFGHDSGVDSSAHVELGRQARESGTHAGCQIVQDLVGNGFVEGAGVPIRPDIEFERFQLDTEGIWHIIEGQRREIRLPGLGAQAGEFRDANSDRVVAQGIRIREEFERIPRGPRAFVSQFFGSLSRAN